MLKRILIAAGAVGLLAAGTAVQAQDKPTGELVKGEALKEMFSKPRMGFGYSTTLASLLAIGTQPNGDAAVQLVERKWLNWQGTGTWRVVGDTFCTTFPTAPVTTESCVHMYRQGDGSFQSWGVSDDKLQSTGVAKRLE